MPQDLTSITERLRNHLRCVGQQRLEKNLTELLDTGGFEDRFAYFDPFVPQEGRDWILVSGSAAGSELVVARQHGFRRAVGTEVNRDLAALASHRVAGIDRCWSVVYGGGALPFPQSAFSAIASGHVIEHTPDPAGYLAEHLRVLMPGGFMFLEFPDRNHSIELHTQLVGFEWAPEQIRDKIYERLTAATWLSADHRRMYHEVRTELRPLSIPDIARMLEQGETPARVVHAYKPAPGFVRMVVARDRGGTLAARERAAPVREAPLASKGPGRPVAEAVTSFVAMQAFVLWAVRAFFGAGKTVSPALEERLRGWAPASPEQPAHVELEDTFIGALFEGVSRRVPELTGPHGDTVLGNAFRHPRLERCLRQYLMQIDQSRDGAVCTSQSFESWCRDAEDTFA